MSFDSSVLAPLGLRSSPFLLLLKVSWPACQSVPRVLLVSLSVLGCCSHLSVPQLLLLLLVSLLVLGCCSHLSAPQLLLLVSLSVLGCP